MTEQLARLVALATYALFSAWVVYLTYRVSFIIALVVLAAVVVTFWPS